MQHGKLYIIGWLLLFFIIALSLHLLSSLQHGKLYIIVFLLVHFFHSLVAVLALCRYDTHISLSFFFFSLGILFYLLCKFSYIICHCFISIALLYRLHVRVAIERFSSHLTSVHLTLPHFTLPHFTIPRFTIC